MISQLCTDNKKTNRATRNKGNKCTNRPTNKKGNKTGASQPHNPKVKTSSNQPSSPLKMSDKKQHSAQDLMEEFDRLRTQLAAIFHRLHPEDQAEARATLRSTFPEPATAVNRLGGDAEAFIPPHPRGGAQVAGGLLAQAHPVHRFVLRAWSVSRPAVPQEQAPLRRTFGCSP